MGETHNAAIESARAGEVGKGFSVVAQEVGNLATSTKSSHRNVNDIIVRLQPELCMAAEMYADS
ncbi:MAG: methyl-accepting chemotaxis protein [Lachnospiraceae bacterium]|nr:methyl-accepting chemotaxis protein [Lachnospiraceae bacterium]